MAVCVPGARLAFALLALMIAAAATPAEARGRHHHHQAHHHSRHIHRHIHRHVTTAAPEAPQAGTWGGGWEQQQTAWDATWGQNRQEWGQPQKQSWGDPEGTWGGAAGWSHQARAERSDAGGEPAQAGGLKALVAQHARANGVPVALADAVVRIESGYNPRARNRSGALGLMQIKAQTARGQGFTGSASALMKPENNLRYAMRYLATAYRMSGGDVCKTVMRYQSGHYARHMSGADRSYCSKARRLMAQS